MGIKVNFNDDGEGYIDEKDLAPVLTPYQQRIQELQNELNMTKQSLAAKEAINSKVNEVLGDKDEYRDAKGTLDKAYGWLNNVVVELQRQHGLTGTMSANEAIDLLSGTEVEEEFKKEFYNMDLGTVLNHNDSKRHLRSALDHVLESENKALELFESRNTVEGIFDNLSQEDIEGLDDNAVEKLLNKMYEE